METKQKIQKSLDPKHQKELENSGITHEQVGHFSSDAETTKKLVGYLLPGLIFSYNDPAGKPYLRSDGKPFYRIKPDWGDLKTENSPKYLSPRGEGCRPYISILYPDWEKAIQSVKIDLWETEGEKKGDCGCTNGLATIAFAGVDGWVDSSPRDGEEQLSKSRTLPELDKIKWNDRRVYQCFDSDIIEKIPVQKALAKRAFVLTKVGAFPHLVLLPNEIDGSKNGLDDFVVRHGIEALKILARVSEPTSFKVTQSNNEATDLKITLCLKEPDTHYKSLMATSVLKDIWAFRPGVGWYEWEGKCWKLCTCVEFEETLVRFMDAQKWKNRSSAIMTSIIRELQSRLMVKDDDWNPINKLVFQNGTLNLTTEEFNPKHMSKDYITRVRPYKYTSFEASANWYELCPIWMKFLDEATGGNPEIKELLRAWLKYVLMPKPKDRKAEIEKSLDLFGAKGTGKGTFLDVMIQLVGIKNIGPASPDTFKSGKDLGQLIDKDLAMDSDCSGFLENVGVYNKVVSNEPVEVKKLYKDPYITRLGVVVVRAYNAHIQVPNASEGLDRRLTVIPFQNQPKVIDHGLSMKLERELSEIFAWVWHLSIQEMRDRILTSGSIAVVAQASIERFAADNPEYQFLLEEFPEGHTLIKAGHLHQKYSEWCKNNNYKAKNQHTFAPSIQKLGCKRRETRINGCYYYNIPDMSQFDIARHLGINPQYLGYSRPSGDLKQDISNPHLEGNRDICRPCLEKSCYIENQVSLDLLNQQHTNSFPNIPNVSMPLYIDTSDEYERSKQGLESTLDISIVGSPPLDWQPMIGEHIEAKKYNDTFHPGTIDAVPTKHSDPSKSTSFWKITFDDGSKGIIWDLIDLHRIDKF